MPEDVQNCRSAVFQLKNFQFGKNKTPSARDEDVNEADTTRDDDSDTASLSQKSTELPPALQVLMKERVEAMEINPVSSIYLPLLNCVLYFFQFFFSYVVLLLGIRYEPC